MAFDRTTSQVLFDNGTHKCISFTSLVKGEGVQANQFLIIDNNRAAVLDPGGDLTYVPLTMELNKYTRLTNLDYVMAWHQDPGHHHFNAALVGLYRSKNRSIKIVGAFLAALELIFYERPYERQLVRSFGGTAR